MKRMTGCLCLAIALAIALPPPPARATDYTVTHAGGKEGIYCDPPPAFNADLLSELLANCVVGDTVTVEAGTYTLTDANSQTLVLTHGVKLIGKGMPVLDGGGKRRVIEYRSLSTTTPSATLLSGFVIRNGLVDPNDALSGPGGGMHIDGGSLTVEGCIFMGNEAKSGVVAGMTRHLKGGGLAIVGDCSPQIVDCTFMGNAASHGGGGGMWIDARARPVVTGCTFSGNTTTDGPGGGMFVEGGGPTVTGCTFSGNAADEGGGMWIAGDGTTVKGCVFKDNTSASSSGGAIHMTGGTVEASTFAWSSGGGMWIGGNGSPSVTNCTFSENDGDGLTIANGARPTVTNCTLVGSSGNEVHASGTSSPKFVNTLLWNDDASRAVVMDGNAAVSLTSCAGPAGIASSDSAAHVTVSTWPSRSSTVEMGHTVYRIEDNAPALDGLIGSGTSAGAPAADQLGQTRKSPPCIGAVERDGPTSISLDKVALSLAVGSSDVLTVTVVPAGATVVWASTDPAVASVDDAGQVTAVAPGAAAVTATADGQMAVCVVTVGDGSVPVTGISLDRTSLSLAVGSADVLTATTVPAGAQVAWASTHPAVASVDATGQVTAVAPGAAAITATAGGRMAVCVVTVGDGRPGGTSGGGGCSSLGLGGLAMVACAASVLKRKAQRHRRTRTS